MAQREFGFAAGPTREAIAPGAWLLRGFALSCVEDLLAGVEQVAGTAPFRHWTTPGGGRMSAAMTNCGALGWVSDARGYRYTPTDPLDGRAWPAMPVAFKAIAGAAAAAAGYVGFVPDACLVNRYEPGARMALHQDRDERDHAWPIVSVSLGASIRFLFGGLRRTDQTLRLRLDHGDVAVWGGPSRHCHHGVGALPRAAHARLGACRINLTFRVAG